MATHINPQSDATWLLTVKDTNGALVTNAAVMANVYSPSGTHVGTDVNMAHQGSGVYLLPIEADWSDVGGDPISGEFLIVVVVTRSGLVRTQHFRYVVRFDDDS